MTLFKKFKKQPKVEKVEIGKAKLYCREYHLTTPLIKDFPIYFVDEVIRLGTKDVVIEASGFKELANEKQYISHGRSTIIDLTHGFTVLSTDNDDFYKEVVLYEERLSLQDN